MFRTWLIYSLGFIAAFTFFLFYKMWVAWYFLVIMLLLPVASFFMALIASRNFTVDPKCPAAVMHNDKAYINVEISGIGAYLAFMRFGAYVEDIMADTNKRLGVFRCDLGGPDIPIVTDHCGAFVYRIKEVKVCDLLGFWAFKRHFDLKFKVLVRPDMIMPGISPDLNGYKARGLRRSRSAYTEIYDFREYVPGDPIRSIHWKVSAKRDSLLVREMQEECYANSKDLVNLTEPREKIDQRLGEILFTTTFFIEHDLFSRIRVKVTKNRETAFDVESAKDLDRVMVKILHMTIPKEASDED